MGHTLRGTDGSHGESQPMEPQTLTSAAAPQAAPAPSAPGTPLEASAAPRLDLSRLEPPRNLAAARLEEMTIDGICGVY